jgi:hypothetical protein
LKKETRNFLRMKATQGWPPDKQQVGGLEIPVDERLRLHVVEVLHAFGALQAPADGVAAVVRDLKHKAQQLTLAGICGHMILLKISPKM